MKQFLSFLFYFLPFTIIAQLNTEMTNNNLNSLFDSVVLNDTTYQVIKTNNFPKSDSLSKNISLKLDYLDLREKGYLDLREILDNPKYSEIEKIKFLREALADKNRDVFEDINYYAIKFWRSSNQAKELMDMYFEKKESEKVDIDDKYTKYRYFEFKTKNLYPDTYQLITNYFRDRNNNNLKYHGEGDLIYRLIELKKEREAVDYLEILVNDYLDGKIQFLTLGDRSSHFYNGIVFDFLCFSEDSYVSKKSTDLLFKLLELKDFAVHDLYKLSAHIDLHRHIRMLVKRFEYFENIDFTSIDLTKLNDSSQKNYYDLVPEAGALFSFMSNYTNLIGEFKGRDLWKRFIEIMPYWGLSGNSFESSQIYILENSFNDKTLTEKEMQTMLLQAKNTERFFKERTYNGDNGKRFLRLVCIAYPDKKISKQDFENLQLEQIIRYSFPLEIHPSELQEYPYRKPFDGQDIDKVVSILNNFASEKNMVSINLTEIEKFRISLKSVGSCINQFFRLNNKLVGFDAEDSDIPTNYVDFFESNFQEVLKKSGIEDIEISQTTTKIQENGNDYNYTIFVKCKESIYCYEYSEYGTEWYQPQRLVKMLNLCLMDKKILDRFVEVETGDQSMTYFLTEPSKLKPILNLYSIGCSAVLYNDEFHDLNR